MYLLTNTQRSSVSKMIQYHLDADFPEESLIRSMSFLKICDREDRRGYRFLFLHFHKSMLIYIIYIFICIFKQHNRCSYSFRSAHRRIVFIFDLSLKADLHHINGVEPAAITNINVFNYRFDPRCKPVFLQNHLFGPRSNRRILKNKLSPNNTTTSPSSSCNCCKCGHSFATTLQIRSTPPSTTCFPLRG